MGVGKRVGVCVGGGVGMWVCGCGWVGGWVGVGVGVHMCGCGCVYMCVVRVHVVVRMLA